MKIGGLQKFSLLDYPEHISAIIFTQGCNFRCHFCYNPELISQEKIKTIRKKGGQPAISEAGLFDFLEKRKGKLDAVVVTGGEPTIHADLPEFIRKIKNAGYLVKLDTNGTNPAMLEKLIGEKAIDYLAMDIKAQYNKYRETVNAKADSRVIKRSVKLATSSGLPYEFRTTLVPGLHDPQDIEEIGKGIQGADKWYLQAFKSGIPLVNTEYEGKKAFSARALKEMQKIGGKYVKQCEIR